MPQESTRKSRSSIRQSRGNSANPGIDVSQTLSILATGTLDIEQLVPWSSNYTFLVRVLTGTQELRAIYKPSRGERPLWDFPTGTLARREYAAFLVSSSLGWPNIPPTVLRDGPQGHGAVQLFIDAVEGEHYFTLRDSFREEMKRIAVFDAVINNTDRKAGHILLSREGTIWCIDHGVTFHEHPKLRTVIWDFTLEPIPSQVLADLRVLKSKLNRGDPLGRSLGPLLSQREIDALCQRTGDLINSGVFPEPPEDWPHIPWPPI